MFQQIELKYNFNALEPHIDELTMNTHYSKHHAAYTTNLNAAIEKLPDFSDSSIEDIFIHLDQIKDDALRAAVQNNGGGFYNHNLYFEVLLPNGSTAPKGELLAQIESDFGDINFLKDKLALAGASRFGSGWAWLSANKKGALRVSSSPNQDNPIMESKGEWVPILGIDVWEHAYYLKYKNQRADYIKAFLNIVNWDVVADKYSKVKAS